MPPRDSKIDKPQGRWGCVRLRGNAASWSSLGKFARQIPSNTLAARTGLPGVVYHLAPQKSAGDLHNWVQVASEDCEERRFSWYNAK